MSALSKAKKRSVLLAELFKAVDWKLLRSQRDADAETVLWIHHRYPQSWRSYLLHGDGIVKDLALAMALAKSGTRFQILTANNISDQHARRIYYSIDRYNPLQASNYAAGLDAALTQLAEQQNLLFPSVDEARWWENKIYMHQRFEQLGINSPRTEIADLHTTFEDLHARFGSRFLIKEPQSCNSVGVHLVDGNASFLDTIAALGSSAVDQYLVQELVDMHQDLRCTIIGGEIVHHYFRINLGEEWRPTSTRRGSRADFETFPEHSRAAIVEAANKTGLRSCAFDICWAGDDLTSAPIFLEVSPAFSPNPPPPPGWGDKSYASFKEVLTGPDSYPRAQVKIIFDLHEKILDAWSA